MHSVFVQLKGLIGLVHRRASDGMRFIALTDDILFVFHRYDNEYGYSNRVIDLLKYIYGKDHQ